MLSGLPAGIVRAGCSVKYAVSVLLQCCRGLPANLAMPPASSTRSGSGLVDRLTMTMENSELSGDASAAYVRSHCGCPALFISPVQPVAPAPPSMNFQPISVN